MGTYVIDAYAWVEYFNGTALGEKVRVLVENQQNKIVTNIVTLAELSSSYHRGGLNFDAEEKSLLSLSTLYHPDASFAVEAGRLHAELRKTRKHIGLADTFVLLTARKCTATIVTGDEDFRGLKEVLMIK